MKIKIKHLNLYAKILAASFLFSLAVNMFFLAGDVVVGGITGVATVINILSGGIIPVGVLIIAMNVPLCVFSLRRLGKRFIFRSVIGMSLSSFAVDILANVLPVTINDPLLCAIFGGISIGASLGLFFSVGFNTGGSDIAVFLVKNKFPRLSAGIIVLFIDGIVVLFAAIVLKDLMSIFYSAITIFISSQVLDYIVSGVGKAKMTLIISEKTEEVAKKISEVLVRGLTLIHGKGWYNGGKRDIILCVVPKTQIFDLKTLISDIDPSAFLIVADAAEVIGSGFTPQNVGKYNNNAKNLKKV